MKVNFTTTDLEDFYEKLNAIGFLHTSTPPLHEFEILKKFGTGYMRRYSYQNGLHITLGNMTLHEDFTYSFAVQRKYFELIYVKSGYIEVFSEDTKQRSRINAGESILFVTQNCTGWARHPKQEHIHFLSINIEEEYILSLGARGIDINTLINFFQKISAVHNPHKLNVDMETLINKIFLCPYDKEIIQKMFFEAVVLEILSEYLFRASIVETIPKLPIVLSDADIERLYMAKRILTEKMTNPPSITELSKIICLNTCKLKIGFKALFACTIYGYLRHARMEKAKFLLKNTQLSIHDIALQLGYCSGSSLSPIFKDHYGITPKQYQQREDSDIVLRWRQPSKL